MLEKTFKFLKELRKNNNREWFHSNKYIYEEAKNEFEIYVTNLIPLVANIDKRIMSVTPSECLFRIFRDVRFSKNKLPYKINFGAYLNQGGKKSNFAGYYLHLEPGNSFIGGGIYCPQPPVLRAVRESIFNHTEEFKNIINNPQFKKTFDSLIDEKLTGTPRGFSKDFEDIELLKYKSYTCIRKMSDTTLQQKKAMDEILKTFKVQYHFNQYLNNAIDENNILSIP